MHPNLKHRGFRLYLTYDGGKVASVDKDIIRLVGKQPDKSDEIAGRSFEFVFTSERAAIEAAARVGVYAHEQKRPIEFSIEDNG